MQINILKKGSARDILLISVLLFGFGLAILIVHYTFNTVTDIMLNVTTINESSATRTALGTVRTLSNRLDYVFFGLFIALTLSMILTGYFVGGLPIFMFIYFLVVVIGVAISALFANVWEDVNTLSVLGASLASFPIANHIIGNLPYYVTIIGMIGILVMFAKPYFQGQQ